MNASLSAGITDTIAAVATPRAAGGISVIRISGNDAVKIASEIFSPVSSDIPVVEMGGYTCAYGRIFDDDIYIDDGVLTIFKAPKSYTGENTVEISCHGGIFITDRVLEVIISKGARIASAGEFTKRSFLNGKMSLTQAEAVMALINSEGRESHRAAVSLREGALFKKISKISDELLNLLGKLAAWIDYPEDDIPAVSEKEILKTLTNVINELKRIINNYDNGKILREGIDTVIVGKPNVGKSTLMNLLSGSERSIVTEKAGTTRDIIEEPVRLGDIILRLSDTAGIRETEDSIENEGVNRAYKKLESAGLILAVFDNSEPLSDEDYNIIKKCRDKRALAVINKSDKDTLLDQENIIENFRETIIISAGKGDGITKIEKSIKKLLELKNIDAKSETIVNERQRACIKKSLDSLKNAVEAIKSGTTLDAVIIILDEAENALLELTGEHTTEAVIDEVFSHFCVGK